MQTSTANIAFSKLILQKTQSTINNNYTVRHLEFYRDKKVRFQCFVFRVSLWEKLQEHQLLTAVYVLLSHMKTHSSLRISTSS